MLYDCLTGVFLALNEVEVAKSCSCEHKQGTAFQMAEENTFYKHVFELFQ